MNVWFVLLHISTIFSIVLLIYIFKTNKKTLLHNIFFFNIIFVIIWSVGRLLENYLIMYTGRSFMLPVYIAFIGIIFLPLCLMHTGIILVGKKMSYKYIVLAIPQIISTILLFTNEYHNLFFVKYSVNNAEAIYGNYFYTHTLVSYIYIFIGLYFMSYFSIANSGFFSRQSFLILFGIAQSLVVNIISTFKFIELPYTTTPVSFSLAIICFYISIIKFDFFNMIPLAMKNIVNEISECFIVINTEFKIVEYNEPFVKMFSPIIDLKSNVYLNEIQVKSESGTNYIKMLTGLVEKSFLDRDTFYVNTNVQAGEVINKYFSIEVTPVIQQDVIKGTIILFKDVTELKNTQSQLLAKEKFASLGQLMGGIAHSLKTPIATLGDSIEIIEKYANEYEKSIDNEMVTKSDHHEIANDMKNNLAEMKTVIKYMADVINTVKNYSTEASLNINNNFTIKSLKDTICVLMGHELKKHNCKLNFRVDISDEILIKGDIRNMVQVVDVLISNAIQSYDENVNGIIDLIIDQEDRSNIKITIRDYGNGIPIDIQKKLLNKMCTTKGNKGTGIGLYVSKTIIDGQFSGKLTFESKVGKGSSFYITVPKK